MRKMVIAGVAASSALALAGCGTTKTVATPAPPPATVYVTPSPTATPSPTPTNPPDDPTGKNGWTPNLTVSDQPGSTIPEGSVAWGWACRQAYLKATGSPASTQLDFALTDIVENGSSDTVTLTSPTKGSLTCIAVDVPGVGTLTSIRFRSMAGGGAVPPASTPAATLASTPAAATGSGDKQAASTACKDTASARLSGVPVSVVSSENDGTAWNVDGNYTWAAGHPGMWKCRWNGKVLSFESHHS